MDPREFRSRIDYCHREWLSNILGIKLSTNSGIDLIDEEIGIELKSRYDFWHSTFAVHYYQVDQFKDENQDKELFWAFLIYGLKIPPRKIKSRDVDQIVTNRNVWFFPWDWIKQFDVWYPKTGPYIYVHKKDFPPNNKFRRFRRKGGVLYVPQDSMLTERFNP